MKHLFAIAPAAVVVWGLSTPCARAQAVVFDPTNLAQSIVNEARSIAEMIQEWQMANNEWQALAHGNNVLGVATGLLGRATQLPGSTATALPGLTFGSTMSAPGGQFYAQSHYYTPQGTDFDAQEIKRREQAAANIQGEALQGEQTADQRIVYLNQMQSDIQNQNDVTALASTAAHINSEQNFLANEQAKIQRLELQTQVQARVDELRSEEEGRQEDDEFYNAASAEAFGP